VAGAGGAVSVEAGGGGGKMLGVSAEASVCIEEQR
jgi:hypothetical protein